MNNRRIAKAVFCLLMLQGGMIDRSRAHNLQKQLRDKFKDIMERRLTHDLPEFLFLSYERLDIKIFESNAELDAMNKKGHVPRHVEELTSKLNGIMEQVLLLNNATLMPTKAVGSSLGFSQGLKNERLLDSLFHQVHDFMHPQRINIQEKIKDLQNQVYQLTGEVSRLTRELSTARSTSATLNSSITTLAAEKAKQDKLIKDLEKKLDDCKIKFDERFQLIQQLSDAKAAFTKVEKDIESFQNAKQELEKSNSEKDKKILDLQEKMLQRDEQMTELLNRLMGEG